MIFPTMPLLSKQAQKIRYSTGFSGAGANWNDKRAFLRDRYGWLKTWKFQDHDSPVGSCCFGQDEQIIHVSLHIAIRE